MVHIIASYSRGGYFGSELDKLTDFISDYRLHPSDIVIGIMKIMISGNQELSY